MTILLGPKASSGTVTVLCCFLHQEQRMLPNAGALTPHGHQYQKQSVVYLIASRLLLKSAEPFRSIPTNLCKNRKPFPLRDYKNWIVPLGMTFAAFSYQFFPDRPQFCQASMTCLRSFFTSSRAIAGSKTGVKP